MKKLGYIFLCMVALWGCQDNADYPFKGKDAVYFQLQTDDYYWTETLDSMVYTFAGKGVDEDYIVGPGESAGRCGFTCPGNSCRDGR